MDNSELQNKIEELSSRLDKQSTLIQEQDEKILELQEKPVRLDRYLDNQSKDIVEDIIKDRIFDVVWNDYFYDFQFMGSANVTISQGVDSGGDSQATFTAPGIWATSTSGSGSFDIASPHVTLITGATNASGVSFDKKPDIQNVIRMDKEQRFRTAFELTATTNQTAHFLRGDVSTSIYYGFRVTGSTLQGVTRNGGTANTVTLISGITADRTYDIEARLYPNNRVDFYVREETVDTDFILRTSTALEIPLLGIDTGYIDFRILNTAAEDKRMKVSFVEYIQKK